MPKYLESGHPDNIVTGQLLLGYIHCMPQGVEYRQQVFFEELGVDAIEADQWYPLAGNMRAFRRLEEELGPKTLFMLGKAVAEHAILPELVSLRDFLVMMQMAHLQNAKGEDLGEYGFVSYDEAERQALMRFTVPYPEQFNLGILTEFARRLRPEGSIHTTVMIDETKPMRSKGDESSTYVIRW